MTIESLVGDFPAEWTLTTLGEICQRGGGLIQTGPFGSQLHAADYVPVGIPSIMPQNIGDNRVVLDGIARITTEDAKRLNRYLVRPGDIVYSRRGDVERRALITENESGWLCGTGCLRIRFGSFEFVDPHYASFYLGHFAVREWIVRHAIGATMPNLNTSILSALPFALPPLPEQRVIADILGSLDNKIELNRRMNRTLEALARALFKSWFVDFGPVRAKMEGRAPAGMDVETAALFPSAFDGDVPVGWKLGSILDVARLLSGGTPSTADSSFWGGEIDWVSAKDVSNVCGLFLLESEKKITQKGVDNSSTKLLPEKTTIVTARGTVGAHCMLGYAMTMNQTNYGLKANPEFGDYFVFLTLSNMVEQLKQQSYGTIFDTITTRTFQDTKCVQPPISVAQAFESQVTLLMDAILINQKQSRTLAALRDTLLPRLMSGGVRIASTP